MYKAFKIYLIKKEIFEKLPRTNYFILYIYIYIVQNEVNLSCQYLIVENKFDPDNYATQVGKSYIYFRTKVIRILSPNQRCSYV